MLRIIANLDTLFKLLDWIIYLCLCTIAVIFFWHELEQFHSKYSSFKEYEESIQESPAIVFCFDPFKKITNVATNDENSLALDLHISRVLDFSRDARKIDPFLARKCEKCEESFVP